MLSNSSTLSRKELRFSKISKIKQENPSLSAERKADRNSNLFEGLSAFSFCKDARGSARDGQS